MADRWEQHVNVGRACIGVFCNSVLEPYNLGASVLKKMIPVSEACPNLWGARGRTQSADIENGGEHEHQRIQKTGTVFVDLVIDVNV